MVCYNLSFTVFNQKIRVCKIICINHHRLFDTPAFCIIHIGFDNTVISWKKLVEKFWRKRLYHRKLTIKQK